MLLIGKHLQTKTDDTIQDVRESRDTPCRSGLLRLFHTLLCGPARTPDKKKKDRPQMDRPHGKTQQPPARFFNVMNPFALPLRVRPTPSSLLQSDYSRNYFESQGFFSSKKAGMIVLVSSIR